MKTRKTTCSCCEVPEHQVYEYVCNCCGNQSVSVDIPAGWKQVRMIESVSVGGTPPVETKHICGACMELTQIANLVKQS